MLALKSSTPTGLAWCHIISCQHIHSFETFMWLLLPHVEMLYFWVLAHWISLARAFRPPTVFLWAQSWTAAAVDGVDVSWMKISSTYCNRRSMKRNDKVKMVVLLSWQVSELSYKLIFYLTPFDCLLQICGLYGLWTKSPSNLCTPSWLHLATRVSRVQFEIVLILWVIFVIFFMKKVVSKINVTGADRFL